MSSSSATVFSSCQRPGKPVSNFGASLKRWLFVLPIAAIIFTGCKKDDTYDLSKKIIGKWIITDVNRHQALTNDIAVLTFISSTQATLSASRSDYSQSGDKWADHLEYAVSIDGNKATLTSHIDDNITLTAVMTVTHINDIEMESTFKFTATQNGEVLSEEDEQTIRWQRVNKDYSTTILGLWEGHVTDEMGSEYDDGEEHRWEFLDNGSFLYYNKIDDEWQLNDDAYAYYFVDGYLLCFRWKNNGEGQYEKREWWEITSVEDNVMNWAGIRIDDNGSAYSSTFRLTKIE